jgi:hypothetical protein
MRYYRAFVITEARRWLQKRLELESCTYSQDKTFVRFSLVVEITITAVWHDLITKHQWKYERVILVNLPSEPQKIININFKFKKLFNSQSTELWKNLAESLKLLVKFRDRQGIEIGIPLVEKSFTEYYGSKNKKGIKLE